MSARALRWSRRAAGPRPLVSVFLLRPKGLFDAKVFPVESLEGQRGTLGRAPPSQSFQLGTDSREMTRAEVADAGFEAVRRLSEAASSHAMASRRVRGRTRRRAQIGVNHAAQSIGWPPAGIGGSFHATCRFLEATSPADKPARMLEAEGYSMLQLSILGRFGFAIVMTALILWGAIPASASLGVTDSVPSATLSLTR